MAGSETKAVGNVATGRAGQRRALGDIGYECGRQWLSTGKTSMSRCLELPVPETLTSRDLGMDSVTRVDYPFPAVTLRRLRIPPWCLRSSTEGSRQLHESGGISGGMTATRFARNSLFSMTWHCETSPVRSANNLLQIQPPIAPRGSSIRLPAGCIAVSVRRGPP